jgi:hypothetical protein
MTHRTGINKLTVAVIVGLGMVGSSAAALAGGCGGMGYKKPMANAPQAGYVHSGAYAPGAAYPVGMGYGGYKDRHASKTAIAKPNIVDTAKAAGSFNTLLSALNATELTGVLEGEGPFTVFAPTDEAFSKLPEGTLNALLSDPDKLAAVLKYHVVAGELTSSEVVEAKELQTVEGEKLPVASIDIAQTDVMTGNGVIHVINEVLIPPTI